MTTSVADFIDRLRDHQLLEATRLEELARSPDAGAVDAATLGQCLIQLRWLTAYQVEQVLAGQPETLMLGPYQILDRQGDGPLGPTYKVRHPHRERLQVVRVLPLALLGDPIVQQRLGDEVHAAGRLHHAHLARVDGIELVAEHFIYLREYVAGTDLDSLVQASGPLPAGPACALLVQAARALQAAHDHGLVHGHLTGANLIAEGPEGAAPAGADGQQRASPPLAAGATIKVTDLGLAALHETAAGQPLSSVGAAARTQKDLRDLGRALAGVLYGQAPLPSDWHLPGAGGPDAAKPALEIAPPLQDIIRRLLGEGPTDAYRTAAEAVAALSAYLEGQSVSVAEARAPVATGNEAPSPLPAAPAATAVEEVPTAAKVAAPPPVERIRPAPPPPAALPEPMPPPADETVAEDQELRPVPLRKPAKKARKYGVKFYLLAALGLVLHLAFIVGVIWVLFKSADPAPTGRNPTFKTIKPKAKSVAPS